MMLNSTSIALSRDAVNDDIDFVSRALEVQLSEMVLAGGWEQITPVMSRHVRFFEGWVTVVAEVRVT